MVTFNGRITLPAEVRKELGLKTGDNVDFVGDGKGCFSIHHRAPESNLPSDSAADDVVEHAAGSRYLETLLG
jgi:AbrB family looped-hinge helix DNA binding protein